MTAPFQNPVLRGVAPDPSVCRVGNDFFLATSTFDFWPGIPIHHSTDLVHWELIGHAATRPGQVRKDADPGGPFVLFAPTLRYCEGTFFVACTNVAPASPAAMSAADGLGWGDDPVGNFIVHTVDPAGEWSDAAWVDTDGFDPSLTFADGTCYYTRRSLDIAHAETGLGPVMQAEIDPFTGKLAADLTPITAGRDGFCSNDIEGPHLYRIGDWYYLFSAEGGTFQGHMQTCGRSRSPWGPFEPAPHNPVLTHRHRVLHPIQRTGHAELIDAPDGTWWALFLATRPTPGGTLLGRETFLAPVRWRDGWPVIGHDGTVELRMPAPALPQTPARATTNSPWLHGWSTRHYPVDGLEIDDERIHLPASPRSLDDQGAVAAVFLRQLEHCAQFHATLTRRSAGVTAGLTAYVSPQHHYDLQVNGQRVTFRRRATDLITEETRDLPAAGPVTLAVETDGSTYRFSASAGGTTTGWQASARLLDPDIDAGFGSVRLGLFNHGPCGGRATFTAVGGQHVG